MPASKQWSPAELAALEHAFAADPSSDAYRPLTEAYVDMGRFMEAMVVCKKGVKAHPGDVGARLLLARVYAEQGKDRKALEEVQSALQERPGDAVANRMAGELQLKLGDRPAGEAALRRAAEARPGDPETLEALKRWNVSPSAPAPAAPVPGTPHQRPARAPSEGIPVAPRVTPRGSPVAAPAASGRPAPSPPASRAAPGAPQRRADPDRNVAYAQELAEKYSTQEFHIPSGKTGEIPIRRREGKGPGLKATMLLLVALAAGLVGWYAFTSWRKARDQEVARLLKEAGELIAKDTFSSYGEAAKKCERVVELKPEEAGYAFLAYVAALRYGEHGGGDAVRGQARTYLEAAQKSQRESLPHSHAIAASAYLKFFGGDPRGAAEELERVLKGPGAGTSGLLYGALGIIQMQSGDLDAARESLTTARKFADRDVRVNQMLAEQYRRRGDAFLGQAKTFYEAAYRVSKEHVPTLLGGAMVYLDEGQADAALRFVQAVLDQGDASPRQLALAHALKGAVLFARGKTSEGAGEEQQAIVLDPSNADIHAQVGRRKLSSGDVAGAVDAFRRASQMEPQRVDFLVSLASALLRREGGARQAVEALKAASARLSDNARVVKLLGDAYRLDGDLERARAEYERALSMEKRFPEARMALSRVWRERRDFGRALDELERAARDYGEGTTGGAARAYVEMAEVESARGGKAEVVEELYKKALRADAANCAALWYLGRERVDRRSRAFDKNLGKQMLQDYARMCPRGPHAAEASRLAAQVR